MDEPQGPMGPLKVLAGRKRLLGQKLLAEEVHQLGAQHFSINWMIANMLIVDGCRAIGVEPSTLPPDLQMLLTVVAYRYCAHQVETAQQAEQEGGTNAEEQELPAE